MNIIIVLLLKLSEEQKQISTEMHEPSLDERGWIPGINKPGWKRAVKRRAQKAKAKKHI